MTRFPLQPLLDATGLTIREFAEYQGKDRRYGYTLNQRGLTFDQADAAAIRFGLMAYDVWESWSEEADAIAAAEEARLAAEEAARRAKNAERYRRRYHDDPVYRAKQQAKRRAYYAECRAYVLADRRRYYQANRERELARNREYKSARKSA